MARLLMEEAEWAFFEPFLIAIRGRGGRPASDHRLVLDAIFWIARTGSPWRDLPEEFEPSRVFRRATHSEDACYEQETLHPNLSG